MSHVKSKDTRAPVSNSKTELEKIVRRYGAVGYTVGENYADGKAFVSFVLPDSPDSKAPRIPVRIPVDIYRVYVAIHAQDRSLTLAKARAARGGDEWARAERVAWRNLVLWVDAALSAATLGLQTVSEAFFAHAVVGVNGERMIEAVERSQAQLGPGVRALLASVVDAETHNQ